MTILATPSTSVTAAGMTALQLAQKLWQKCRRNGSITSILNQTGERKDFVDHILWAWMEIQTAHQDWLFMRRSTSFVTVAGQALYTTVECGIVAGAFGRWIPQSFRSYLTAVGTAGELLMAYEPSYDCWRDTYLLGGNRATRSQPMIAAIAPDKGLALGPVPAAGHTVTADYYKAPVFLSSNNELPELPANHNPMIIVYKAMLEFGVEAGAPEFYAHSERQYPLMMQRLTADQLPEVTVHIGW